jgi:hypothetical protein
MSKAQVAALAGFNFWADEQLLSYLLLLMIRIGRETSED